MKVVQKEVAKDPKLTAIIEKLEANEDCVPKFSLHQGKLNYNGRLVLSQNFILLPSILHTFHDSVFGGHPGSLRTYKCLTVNCIGKE